MGASIVVFSLRNFYKGKTKGKRGKREMGGENMAQAHPTQALLGLHMLEVRGLKSHGGRGKENFIKI